MENKKTTYALIKCWERGEGTHWTASLYPEGTDIGTIKQEAINIVKRTNTKALITEVVCSIEPDIGVKIEEYDK